MLATGPESKRAGQTTRLNSTGLSEVSAVPGAIPLSGRRETWMPGHKLRLGLCGTNIIM